MLKFFRRIRRKLLDEGSLRKYLVYAIGEITLVVIGILIALQINNWNIDRVNSIEEALILDGLHEEMTRYFQTLEGMQRLHAEMLSGMEAILISIEEGRWASDKWSIDAAIARTLFPPTSDLGSGVRDALVQSGRLELIRDVGLREKLAWWPHVYNEVYDDEENCRIIVMKHIIPYYTKKGITLSSAYPYVDTWPVEKYTIAEDSLQLTQLLTDPEFRALIETRYGFWDHAGGEYARALEAAKDILINIEKIRE
jgi:hypothetical protein